MNIFGEEALNIITPILITALPLLIFLAIFGLIRGRTQNRPGWSITGWISIFILVCMLLAASV